MGNRANIVVKEDEKDSGVYFYTHWGGYNLPIILQDALKRKERWYDHSYLARIIFCEMVKDEIDGETGYGISTCLTDNENPIITVQVDIQNVSFNGYDLQFKDYIKLTESEIRECYDRD